MQQYQRVTKQQQNQTITSRVVNNNEYCGEIEVKHCFFYLIFYSKGMVSLYYGYKYKYFWESDEQDMTYWLMGIVVFNTIASLFGALRALYSQTKTIAQPWISKI